jgi:nitrate reductase (NAD(P)H)
MSQLIAFERSASEMSLTELAEAEEEREKIMGRLRKKHHTERVLGLPVGQHLLIKGRTADGRAVVRAYTPLVDVQEAREEFSLLVKVYRTSERHPLGGRMTQWLDSLPLGASVPVKGPLGHISYAQGELTVHGARRCFPHIAFICGGSGITPAFRILRAALEDARDTNRFSLLYSNSSIDDILLRAELEELARRHATRFKLWFTVTSPGDAHDGARWCYSTGRIDADMIRAHIPLGEDGQCFVGLCGPPGLVDDVCVPCLQHLGYDEACIGLF